jgi:hypothetical protein
MGIVGFDNTNEGDLRAIFNIGQPEAVFLKPGNNQVPFQINIDSVQNLLFLLKAVRTSGSLPWLTLGLGYKDDLGVRWAQQIQDCKIHSFDLDLEATGMLRASVSGVGGLITELTTLDPAQLTQMPYMGYEAIMQRGGSAFPVRTFRMSANHNVDVQYVIRGAAPSSFQRGWEHQTEGSINVSGEVTRFARSAVNFQATTLALSTLRLLVTDINEAQRSLDIQATNAGFGSERQGVSPEGDYTFTLPYIAKGFSLTQNEPA